MVVHTHWGRDGFGNKGKELECAFRKESGQSVSEKVKVLAISRPVPQNGENALWPSGQIIA